MEEEAKKALFREICKLDEEESEEEELSNASLILRRSKLAPSLSGIEAGTSRRESVTSSRSNPLHKHTVSAPLSSQSTTLVGQHRPNPGQSFPSTLRVDSSMTRLIHTSIGVDESTHNRTGLSMPKHGKRKRGRSLEPRPESQQIFKGLSFCKTHNPSKHHMS